MTDNLALWHSIEKTPPSEVKEITGKAYKGNSPKPHYIVRKATETFGPCGIGWGFNIVSERLEEGAGGEKVHIAHIRVWYVWDGKRGEVEHVGQTMFCGTRSSGKPYTDEDAPKKSVTDALVKALSMIGFAGDIFSGRYDDSKYINELEREEREERRRLAGASAAETYVEQSLDTIEAFTTSQKLRDWWKHDADMRGHLFTGAKDPEFQRLRTAFEKRGKELVSNENSIPTHKDAAE
jgi:hypothetical protein